MHTGDKTCTQETGHETGRAHRRQDVHTGDRTAHRRQDRRQDVHTGDRTGDMTCTQETGQETGRAHLRHDVHTGDTTCTQETGDGTCTQETKSQSKHVSRSHARHHQNQGQPLVNLLSMLNSILAGWPRGPHSSDERQAQSMMPKIERYTDTFKQAQRQKVYHECLQQKSP